TSPSTSSASAPSTSADRKAPSTERSGRAPVALGLARSLVLEARDERLRDDAARVLEELTLESERAHLGEQTGPRMPLREPADADEVADREARLLGGPLRDEARHG